MIAAELIFRFRDDAGFPKLNLYVDDPILGVRLVPGGEQRLVYAGNPITRVRINAQGYRGAELPPPSAQALDDVIVVGDSQVFGLGVEEQETFSAVLQQKLGGGRRVLNGGVPTYGPDEYAAVARELIEQRKAAPPRTVVFTINLVNDLFEASRPNRDRHAVSDGWAVRKDLAPQITDFPGRALLARRSHLFYAVRSLWHRDTDGQSAASEGTWRDLTSSGQQTAEQRAKTTQAQKQRAITELQTEAELLYTSDYIDSSLSSLLGDEITEQEQLALASTHRPPGAYVAQQVAGLEEGRLVIVTAEQIRKGAAVRAKLRARIAKLAAQPGDINKDLRGRLVEEAALKAKLTELGLASVQAALQTPVAPAIRALKQLCDERGVRLVLLILPIDVAVSAEEWKKYGAEPRDMTGVMALHEEILALAAELGLSALDATAALRAAQPGAFLDRDIHMTPRGHAAVAEALARTLAAPPPPPAAATALSPLPLPSQWNDSPEMLVPGSTAATCETKRVREWLRILCIPITLGDRDSVPQKIELVDDRARAAMTMLMPESAALTVALREGDALVADFTWKHVVRRLQIEWKPGEAKPTAAFTVVSQQSRGERQYQRLKFPNELARSMCDCWQQVYDNNSSELPRCPGIYGDLNPGCFQYREQCIEMVACARRDPSSPPSAAEAVDPAAMRPAKDRFADEALELRPAP